MSEDWRRVRDTHMKESLSSCMMNKDHSHDSLRQRKWI